MTEEPVILYTDGACRGNGKKGNYDTRLIRYAVLGEDGAVLFDHTDIGGSNNIAEFLAILEALRYAFDNNLDSCIIRTDSTNNFAWVYGRYIGSDINDPKRVREIKREVEELKRQVKFSLEWIPRDKNVAGIYLEKTPMIYSI